MLFFSSKFVFSQITTTNAAPYDTEEYLVNDVLLGADLETSNYNSVGFDIGIGYFDGSNSNIGFEEGVILSSGGLEMNCKSSFVAYRIFEKNFGRTFGIFIPSFVILIIAFIIKRFFFKT